MFSWFIHLTLFQLLFFNKTPRMLIDPHRHSTRKCQFLMPWNDRWLMHYPSFIHASVRGVLVELRGWRRGVRGGAMEERGGAENNIALTGLSFIWWLSLSMNAVGGDYPLWILHRHVSCCTVLLLISLYILPCRIWSQFSHFHIPPTELTALFHVFLTYCMRDCVYVYLSVYACLWMHVCECLSASVCVRACVCSISEKSTAYRLWIGNDS